MRVRRLSLLAVVLSFPAFVVAVRVAAAPLWVSPPAQQPGGNIAPSLNTSSQAQTKKGGLTIEGTVNIDPETTLTIGRAGGTSKICWNDECKSGWTELTTTTDYLTLNQTGVPTDSGYIDLDQSVGAPEEATVTGTAGEPSSTSPTYGIQGVTKPGSGESTGVYGLATVGTSSFHYGVFADAGGYSNAWAGYFDGDVAVSDIPGNGTFDLVIGKGSANANGEDPVAEICLNGACKDKWPASSGSGFWTLSGSTLLPLSSPRSIAFAGSGTTAPFYVAVSGTGASSQADITIRGGAKFNQYVVGTPSSSTPAVTCGDGICTNPPENDVYCSMPGCGSPAGYYYCPLDCDVTPPGNVYPREIFIKQCKPRERDCIELPYQLYVVWINPANPDYAGAKVIIRTDRYPTGPNDISSGGPLGGDFPVPAYDYLDLCDPAVTYYAGLYAYDRVGNFAPGTLYHPVCTNAEVVY